MVGGSVPPPPPVDFIRASYFECSIARPIHYNHDVVDNRNFLFNPTTDVARKYDMRFAFSSMRVTR